jgi:hypothetical protein
MYVTDQQLFLDSSLSLAEFQVKFHDNLSGTREITTDVSAPEGEYERKTRFHLHCLNTRFLVDGTGCAVCPNGTSAEVNEHPVKDERNSTCSFIVPLTGVRISCIPFQLLCRLRGR